MPNRSTDDPGHQQNGDQHILPAVERPLMGPPDRALISEWSEIVNHPEIIACGTTRADEVAKQMQVKRQEDQQQRLRSGNPGSARNRRHQKRAKQTVQQKVVINKEVVSWLAAKESIGDIHDDPESIDVRRHARQTNPKPLAPILRAAFG